jgi:hypothetical protein
MKNLHEFLSQWSHFSSKKIKSADDFFMKMLVLLLICMISHSALADCQVTSNGQSISILESSAASLHSKSKSLANHTIQDQDGLGFCYANATSVILKSVIPSHPDLSYIHGALQASTLGPGKNWAKGGRYVRKDKKTHNDVSFVEAGNVCNTIQALKKAG